MSGAQASSGTPAVPAVSGGDASPGATGGRVQPPMTRGGNSVSTRSPDPASLPAVPPSDLPPAVEGAPGAVVSPGQLPTTGAPSSTGVPKSRLPGEQAPASAAESPAGLEGEDIGETPVESLHRAQGRMSDAARRLGAGDTSATTRGLQTEALAALDAVLIREAERRKRGGAGRRAGTGGKAAEDGKAGGKTSGGQSPGDRSDDGQSESNPDANMGEPRPEGSGAGGQEGQDGAAGGTAGGQGSGDGKRPREPMESRAAVMDTEAWGQLPPQLRERLRNSLPERFLPGFETMLEAYYRRLAETPNSRAEGRP